MYIHVCMYVYTMYMCIYIYIYIHINTGPICSEKMLYRPSWAWAWV